MADVTLTSLIDLAYPSEGATGVPLRAPAWVIFSCEMDEDSIKDSLYLEGPNADTWSGPDLALWNQSVAIDGPSTMLASAIDGGLVAGEITFERVKLNDTSGFSGYDYSGTGSLYRTKAIFTATRPLVASTYYYARLVGKENDVKAIRKRSVFDTQRTAGIGTGVCTGGGSYTGSMASDTFHFEIMVGGVVGTATYRWWRASAPAVVYGPIKTTISNHLLVDGVYVSFSTSGSFVADDHFTTVVKTPDEATGLVHWEFQSGSGSISTLPSTASTSVIGLPADTTTAETLFEVLSTLPKNRAFNLRLTEINPIVITFSKALGTVLSSHVKVTSEAVVDDPSVEIPEYNWDLPKRIEVNGSTLSIYI